ncbi:hypothetical protein GALL_401020 [mine drainage metagenome]|uniref:Uncharacterized protein n=1 Tax=mine drainage metagenome TaxID=410659 RepID=A0A1J5Q4I6_9ZZZZ
MHATQVVAGSVHPEGGVVRGGRACAAGSCVGVAAQPAAGDLEIDHVRPHGDVDGATERLRPGEEAERVPDRRGDRADRPSTPADGLDVVGERDLARTTRDGRTERVAVRQLDRRALAELEPAQLRAMARCWRDVHRDPSRQPDAQGLRDDRAAHLKVPMRTEVLDRGGDGGDHDEDDQQRTGTRQVL